MFKKGIAKSFKDGVVQGNMSRNEGKNMDQLIKKVKQLVQLQ